MPGKFDWKDKKFSLFNDPDPELPRPALGVSDLPAPLAPIAFALRLRTVPLRNLGACISPDNAWIFLQGIESLPCAWSGTAATRWPSPSG